MKKQVDEKASWWNSNEIKLSVEDTESWVNYMLIKWQVDGTAIWQILSWQNYKLMKQQVDETRSLLVFILVRIHFFFYVLRLPVLSEIRKTFFSPYLTTKSGMRIFLLSLSLSLGKCLYSITISAQSSYRKIRLIRER